MLHPARYFPLKEARIYLFYMPVMAFIKKTKAWKSGWICPSEESEKSSHEYAPWFHFQATVSGCGGAVRR